MTKLNVKGFCDLYFHLISKFNFPKLRSVTIINPNEKYISKLTYSSNKTHQTTLYRIQWIWSKLFYSINNFSIESIGSINKLSLILIIWIFLVVHIWIQRFLSVLMFYHNIFGKHYFENLW